MAGIAGKAGNLKGKKIAGGNVFEGPRSRDFPVPPPPDSEVNALFRKATTNLGYHPFYAPTANLPRPYKNPHGIARRPYTYSGPCERLRCEAGAKADPLVTVFPGAQKTGKLKLIFHATAGSIRHDGKNA